MEIKIEDIGTVKVISLKGDIDAATAPEVTTAVLPLVIENARLLLDMSGVPYMSSAGLRTLKQLDNAAKPPQNAAKQPKAKLVLVGLTEELRDTMEVTGFLNLFVTKSTQEEGLAALEGN
ncbi:MAG: STAS domain-containing protein [Microcystaceae cyanobacterium]